MLFFISLVLHEFLKTDTDAPIGSQLCALEHIDCQYLTQRRMQPYGIRLLVCGSLGQLHCFFPFLPTFSQESLLEQCVRTEHHSFLLCEEASCQDTQNFFLRIGCFKEKSRQLCSSKFEELNAFIQCNSFKSIALRSVLDCLN